jgi:hypothetical protein
MKSSPAFRAYGRGYNAAVVDNTLTMLGERKTQRMVIFKPGTLPAHVVGDDGLLWADFWSFGSEPSTSTASPQQYAIVPDLQGIWVQMDCECAFVNRVKSYWESGEEARRRMREGMCIWDENELDVLRAQAEPANEAAADAVFSVPVLDPRAALSLDDVMPVWPGCFMRHTFGHAAGGGPLSRWGHMDMVRVNGSGHPYVGSTINDCPPVGREAAWLTGHGCAGTEGIH